MKTALVLTACCLGAMAEMRTIPVTASGGQGMSDPAAAEWKNVPAVSLSLQRTPLLFPTDQPATLDIASVEVRMIRGGGKTLARLEWEDKSKDTASFEKAERAWQSERLVRQSEATNRFSDACALMIPAHGSGGVSPSLQMGDAAHPVKIFFWDSSRGAAIMDASGRETTKRTGQSFPVQAGWNAGRWTAVFELPELAPGTPIAVAVWNGGQQDRDGRKYFSIWYKTQ